MFGLAEQLPDLVGGHRTDRPKYQAGLAGKTAVLVVDTGPPLATADQADKDHAGGKVIMDTTRSGMTWTRTWRTRSSCASSSWSPSASPRSTRWSTLSMTRGKLPA